MSVLIRLLLVGAVLTIVGWLCLPYEFRAAGLHPPYRGPAYEFERHRALIVTTSHSQMGAAKTGVFASELTAPYYIFRDAGMLVDIASIDGGAVPIDPLSLRWYILSDYDMRFQADAELEGAVRNSLKIDTIDFASYDIVYLAGGWGAAYDFGSSETLGQKMTSAWAAQRVVGGVCHGPLGLLLAVDEHGDPLVKGRRLTAVTDKQVRELGIEETPMHPERELRAAGARFESATAFADIFANHVVEDGRLITGQNQNAAPEVAIRMMIKAGARPRTGR